MISKIQHDLAKRTLIEIANIIEVLQVEVRDPFPDLLVPGVEQIQERLKRTEPASRDDLYAIQRTLLLLPELVQQVDLLATTLLRRAVLKAADVIDVQIHAQALEQATTDLLREQSHLHAALLWASTSAAVADLRRIEPLLKLSLEGEMEQLRTLALRRLAGRRPRTKAIESATQLDNRNEVTDADIGSAPSRRRFLVVRKDGSRPEPQALTAIRTTLLEIGREQRLGALDARLQENRHGVPVFQLREDLVDLARERLNEFDIEEDIRLSAEGEHGDLQIKLTNSEGELLSGIPIIVRTNGEEPKARLSDHRGMLVTRVRKTPIAAEIVPEHSFWSYCLKWTETIPDEEVGVTLARISISTESWWRGEVSIDDADGEGNGVQIALIDTGVAPHRDLDLRSGLVVSGLGSIRWDEDAVGHGTFCAGIINGQGAGGTNVRGLAPRAALWCVRAADETTKKEFYLSNVIDGIYDAVDQIQADLINMSLGGRVASAALERAVEYASEQGSLVIAAAGNSAQAGADFPARYDAALGVSAYGKRNTYPASSRHARAETAWAGEAQEIFGAGFSNYGAGVDLCGPGVAICSTHPGDLYRVDDGTSFATPFVTGVAARLLGREKSLLAAERNSERTCGIKELILKRARMIVGLSVDRQGRGRFT